MGGEALALYALDVENQNIEPSFGCDFGIELPQRAGCRIARIGEERFAVFLSCAVERFKAAARHIDLSAHLQKRERFGQGKGNGLDGF